MKHLNRILSFLTIICCLAGSWMPVYATNDSSIPRVTFTNESRNEPNLSVKKTVVNATPGVMAPSGDTFTFTLKLNGSLASEVEYHLYGADGQEKFPPGLNKEFYKTTENGEFSLKANEEAVFEWIGRGVSYEVIETPKQNYQQIKPEGGLAAVGTIPANGAHVTFENKYSETNVSAKTTNLTVSKVVPFPSGYTLPEKPEFTFILKVDGKLHHQEVYTVTDTKTGAQIRTNQTKEDGSFTLTSGETATFTDIPVGVDYEVEEVIDNMSSHWRPLSDSVQGGATVAPATSIEFKNGLASFAVKKTMKDGSKPKDAVFTFLLTDEAHKVWKDAKYYLYSTEDGELVDDTIHQTTNDGTFVLEANQVAVFIGIPTGTHYNVSEVEDAHYKQTLPLSKAGYTNCTVHDAVEVLPFVNELADLEGVLTVTKQLTYTQDEAPADLTKAFTFRLEKKVVASTEDTDNNTQSSDYQPVANQIFYVNVGDYQYNYKTDDNGYFTLKANETARFRLPAAEDNEQVYYQVTEVIEGMSYDYQLQGDSEKLSGLWTKEGLNFTFVNAYTPDKVNLHLTKKSQTDVSLSGAVFTLYQVEEVQNPTDNNSTEEQNPTDDKTTEPILRETEIGTYEVGIDGITIPGLSSGRYHLRETVAPDGYLLLAEPIVIVVKRLSQGFDVEVTVDGEVVGAQEEGKDFYIEKNYGETYDELYLTIRNDVIYELPSTGGTGTNHYLFLGITLMLLSVSGIYLRKRRAI